MHFILMLTKDDQTVANAMDAYRQVRSTGIRYVGFKDVGIPFEQLRELTAAIKDDARQVMLEVVSVTRDDELRSIEVGRELGVDYLLGGKHVEDGLRVLKGSAIRYFPFCGKTVGHPTILEGTNEEIVEDARRIAAMNGVHGLDLLAYRASGDVPALAKAVAEAVSKPVIAAGSIDRPERVDAMRRAGMWGFTIGSAFFDGRFVPTLLKSQVESVLGLDGVGA